MTKICCVCQRVEYGDHWKNDYVFAEAERVTHGYCPLCFDVVMSELTDYYVGDEESEGDKDGMISLNVQQRSVCV